LKWAQDVIGPRGIFLRVLDDNPHAVAFYRGLGFVEQDRQPLRRHVAGEAISFSPVEAGDTAPPDKHFLRLAYAPEDSAVGQQVILTAGPSISAREAFYAWDAAREGWNQRWSFYLGRFERSFADYLGVKHALATSSCTGALHLALATLGIGPGDEVIVPDITWVATANAVLYVGATPVFADVEPDSWCLDPRSFEAAITPRTKAVIPVHLYGHPARMDELVAIARQHGLFVIEDAAPAIGAEWQGRKTGTFGDFACFSFQGAKLVVTGEGGMLLTNDAERFQRAQSLWDQGRSPTRTFWIDDRGLKYKMANVQAAIGLGQLERVEELIEMKRRLFAWYEAGLAGVPHVRLNYEVAGARSNYWMSSLLLDETAPLTRDALRQRLKERNIDTRPVFPAISQYPIWPRPQAPQPVAQRIGERALNLPSGVCLRRSQVDYVCRCLREILS
jgi:perosamine synthetase